MGEMGKVSLVHEEKGWFGKFLDVWMNPQYGHVFVNKKSKKVNVYFGYRKLPQKVLMWSSSRKARWVTKKWFKNGHDMVLWPDKSRLKVNLGFFGDTFAGMGSKEWNVLTDYLEREEVKSELGSLVQEIQTKLDHYRIGLPIEFIIPWLVLFFSILLYISILDFIEFFTIFS